MHGPMDKPLLDTQTSKKTVASPTCRRMCLSLGSERDPAPLALDQVQYRFLGVGLGFVAEDVGSGRCSCRAATIQTLCVAT
jgi:hypothetical protein